MPAEETVLSLGGWAPDQLVSTIRKFSGTGSDYDIDDAVRFVRGVTAVVRRREAVDATNNDPKDLAVFLLAPDSPDVPDLMREPMLDAGQSTIAGKVWFVNAPVVSGKAKQLVVRTADEVFKVITEDLGLGKVPATIVDPRGKRTVVRFYPKGLIDPDNCASVRLHCSDVDLHQIYEIIERVYQQCLKTPDAQAKANKLWDNPDRFRPKRIAEHQVQAYLKPAFAAAFPSCRVYDEFAGTMGRADLHLEEQNPSTPGNVTFLAVLELKVLRSYSDGGSEYSNTHVTEWVKKGVLQAGAYRKERGHRIAALCCFDMREQDTGDQCFDDVSELAADLNVALRRWFLFASSELARQAVSTPQQA